MQSEDQPSEQFLLACHAVMKVLSEGETFEEVAPRVVSEVARSTGCEAGIFWRQTGKLEPIEAQAIWRSSSAPVLPLRKPEAAILREAWETREPVWRESEGSASAIVPVFRNHQPFGLVQLLFPGRPQPPPSLLPALATVGLQIGQFLEKIQARSLLGKDAGEARELLMHAPAAIAIIRGPDLRYELSNPMNQEFVSGRSLVGRTVNEALPELEAQGIVALLEQVFRSGQPFVGKEVLVELRQDDGSVRKIFVNGIYQPLFDREGRVDRVMVFAYEVTELVEARIRAEEAERSAALIANSVPQIIWTTNLDGQTDFFNQRWYEYTGLSQKDSLQDAWQHVCHPDDLPLLRERFERCFATGEPFEGELRLRRASDQVFRWHLSRSLPLRDASGRIVKWIGTSTDIEDHKQAEERTRFLGAASALLGASLDSETTLKNLAALVVPRMADWCVISLQEAGEPAPRRVAVAHADPERVRRAEEVGRLFPPDPKVATGVAAVIRTGKAQLLHDVPDQFLVSLASSEEQLGILRSVGMTSVMILPLTARGRTFGTISLLATESGRHFTNSDLLSAQDLADRAATAVDNSRLYNEAQRAVELRDEFLSVASHELRTPLTPLQINVQSVQRALQKAEGVDARRLDEKLNMVNKQITRLERLVTGLLDVSRITGHRLTLEWSEVDLSGVGREVVERFGEQARQSGIDLRFVGPSSLVGRWDRLRLDQVVVNLVSNALKFGDHKPVEVEVSAQEGDALLQVRDHGIGIGAADQERIFGRFERAASARHYGGLGLGLWLTRELVEAMGGSIRVESTSGLGSTFTVLFPRRGEVPPS